MAHVTLDDIIAGMKQLEADVIVVAWIHDRNRLSIQPFWECDMDRLALAKYAAHYALMCAEGAGGGNVEVTWIDYRPPPAEAASHE